MAYIMAWPYMYNNPILLHAASQAAAHTRYNFISAFYMHKAKLGVIAHFAVSRGEFTTIPNRS
jgi:hypothetical protein